MKEMDFLNFFSLLYFPRLSSQITDHNKSRMQKYVIVSAPTNNTVHNVLSIIT